MDERSVEPLHVVALREAEQHLVGQDRNGQQENGTRGHGQRERAQPQPAGREGGRKPVRAGAGPGLTGRYQRQRGKAKGRVTRPFKTATGARDRVIKLQVC